jgi:uncharacterized protein (DUF2236 family)
MPADSSRVNIGPGSLLWEFGGDRRGYLNGLGVGILQLMHPDIGAGVEQQSDFFEDPWGRILRSVPEIMGGIYDTDAEVTARRVRDFHGGIKGSVDGRRYSALNPETFWWAHATFHYLMEGKIGQYDRRGLSDDVRGQLYAETCAWYRRYGVSEKPVPKTYADFREKWDKICRDELVMTKVAARSLEMVQSGDIARPPGVPAIVWKLGSVPVGKVARLTTIGALPEIVRERFGIPWTLTDQADLLAFEGLVQNVWPMVPRGLRYVPRARAALHRKS